MARAISRSQRAGGEGCSSGTPARTVIDRAVRRGSCERARTGCAALSTTATRTRGAALAPSAAGRPCNECSGSGLCANVDSGRAAAARRSQAGHAPCARARSRPVPSRPAGTVSAGHAAASQWMQRIGTARRANVQRVGDRRAACAAVEGHRLKVWCGHVSATASGRIWRRPPGQLVTAWPSVGARRMQQAGIGPDSRAARARPCRDHASQESRRTRAHPSAWSAALPSWSLGLRIQPKWIRRPTGPRHRGRLAGDRPKKRNCAFTRSNSSRNLDFLNAFASPLQVVKRSNCAFSTVRGQRLSPAVDNDSLEVTTSTRSRTRSSRRDGRCACHARPST